MELAPAGSADVLNVATPSALSVPVPRVVAPLRKVTVPVGIVAPDCEAAVAVRVMACPVFPELGEEVSVVVLAGSAVPGQEKTVIEKGGSE
jgi:hypothetical protein